MDVSLVLIRFLLLFYNYLQDAEYYHSSREADLHPRTNSRQPEPSLQGLPLRKGRETHHRQSSSLAMCPEERQVPWSGLPSTPSGTPSVTALDLTVILPTFNRLYFVKFIKNYDPNVTTINTLSNNEKSKNFNFLTFVINHRI